MENKKTYIDLFSGCGGLSLGLNNAGWKGNFAIEKSEDAFKTLKHNLIKKKKHFDWPNWLEQKHHDINQVLDNHSKELISLRGKIDLVAGGPPCQGFSMAGRRIENDSRNDLINSYIKFIDLVKPKLIFFENVKGFTLGFKNNDKKGKAYSTYVVEQLEKLGYSVKGQLINFAEYGVPQKRTRFSCDRLGGELYLETIKDEPKAQIETLLTEWDKFEGNLKEEFVNISVLHETISKSNNNLKKGTVLEITNLNSSYRYG